MFAIDTNPLRKGKPVFYHEVVLGIAFFVLFILYYYFIFLLFFVLIWGVSLAFSWSFLFLREEKERIEDGWVGRIWEKIGEGEVFDQNLLNENVFNKKIN